MLYRSQTEIVRLGRKIGVGGEGEVYEVRGQSRLVAKIYSTPPPVEKAEKLLLLAGLNSERLAGLAAWPLDVLRDAPDGQVVGFLMNRIGQAEEVHALHSPRSRLQKFPEASWAFLIHVAANFARAVTTIHEHGFVIGDVNPKNTLVTRQATVFLLDCDSFQVSSGGRTFRCEGGFPEYTPPELQGGSLRERDRVREHDYFGLAVVIFQLLFLGRHPFSGRFLGAEEMSLDRSIRERRFAYGSDAESRRMSPPPGTLALEAVPPAVAELFRRAFLATSAAERPQPDEWVAHLEALAKSLRRCQLHSGHLYYEELPDCPWCELETYTGGLKLFNFLLGGADQERHQIQLDEIWREIESIPPPLPVWVEPLEPPEPSAEALACGRRRVIYERILLVLLALSAFAFTLIAGGATIFTAALAILVSALTRWVTGITTQHWRLFTGPAAKEIMQARRDAMARVRQLQAQWEEESQDEFFFGKLTDLQAQKRFYESLYLLREAKLEHLEAAARATQFDQYLDGFEIDGAEIDGVDAAVKSSLRAGGIATAADLTDHHLKQAPHVGRSRARKLLRWRQELERGFTFDPDRGPSPQAYLEVEKEIHGLRSRLERDLVGGAFSLRKMREEIEENRRSMSPEFADARHVLARAEADFNVAVKSRWLELAVPIMIIAFMFGSFFAWMRKDLGGGFAPSVETSLVDANGRGDRLVEEGRILLQMGQVAEAVLKLEEGARLAPQSQRAQEVLGDGLYQLKRYEESIAASKRAIKIYPTFESYYNLGRAHLARGSGKEAEAAFRLAMTHVSGYPGMERVRGLYPGLARSLIRQGVDEARIQALNAQSEAGRLDTFERLELATLYLYSGRLDEAQKQYRILKSMDPRVADDFKSLMKQRNGP